MTFKELDLTNFSPQDQVFVKEAIELANHAAMALEEAYSYANSIDNKYLSKKVEEEIDRIVEFL